MGLSNKLTCLTCLYGLDFQPPKKKSGKKKGKKKSAKAKTPTIVDGISTEEMSKDQVKYTTFVKENLATVHCKSIKLITLAFPLLTV